MTSLGILLALFAELKYIHSVIQGTSKPNFSAWGIFTISMILVLASSFSLGARSSLWIIAMFTLLHFTTTIIAFRFRAFSLTTFEKIVLVLVGISVFLWIITENAWTALLINVLVDTFGFISILYKLYRHPNTEDTVAWTTSLVAYAINLFTITTWTPQEYLFTISNIFWISLITLLSLRKRSRT
jgi:hypothetical protein